MTIKWEIVSDFFSEYNLSFKCVQIGINIFHT